MRSNFFRTAVIATAVLFALAGTARAADGYTVTVIADGRSSLPAGWAFGELTSLNNLGDVAFLATRGQAIGTDYETLVAFGGGGSFTMVAQGFRPRGGAAGSMLSLPAINNHRQVVYNVKSGHANVPFNGTMLWENGSSRIYMDDRDGSSLGFARGPGGLSDNTRVRARCALGQATCIVGERGVIHAGGTRLSDGTRVADSNDSFGAISRDGRYSAGGTMVEFWDGKAWQAQGYGLVAIGPSGSRAYIVGQTSPSGPTALATAVSVNNTGYASFISDRPGSGSFVGVVDTRLAANNFTRLVDLGTGFTSFGDSTRGSAINNWNEIAFLANPSGDGVFGDNVYVTHVSGTAPKAILKRGDVVTADGAVYWDAVPGTLNTHSFNDIGQVSLQAQLTKDGGQTTFDAIIRVDPLAGHSPGNPVLPAPGPQLPGGGWVLQLCRGASGCFAPVPRRSPVWVDPDIAIGYDYTMSVGGPAIEGVIVPAALANGDELFVLEFAGHTVELKAGTQYSFTDLVAGGVTTFRLSGIDTNEALDPTNPNAFVTGLVFGAGGSDDFSVTMKPLVVSVPEPSSVALLGAGLGWLAWRRRQLQR